MNKNNKIVTKTKWTIVFSSLVALTLSTPLFVTSCTVEKTVISELGKVKFTLTELGKSKTPEQIEEEVNIYGTSSSGTIDVVGIKEDVLFKYVSKPKIGRNVALNIKVVKALQSDDQNEGNPYLLISYTLSKGGYTSKKQNTTLFGEVEVPSTSDQEEVNALVEALKNKQISAKSNANQIFSSRINNENVWTYVDGELQNYISSDETKLRVIIKNFDANDSVGSLAINYTVKKNNYESQTITTNTILGFDTRPMIPDQEQVDALVEYLSRRTIDPTSKASEILPSNVTKENVSTYITGELLSHIDADGKQKPKVVIQQFNYEDRVGSLSISYVVKKNKVMSETQTTNKITGFLAASNPDDIFVSEGLKITYSGIVKGFENSISYPETLNIKRNYNGVLVQGIAPTAFIYNKLTSLSLPNSIKSIGDRAFSQNKLTSLTIPDSVTTIGDSAFVNNQLTSLTLSNSVTTIKNNAFENNQLTNLTLPDSVNHIGLSVFRGNQLTSLTLSNSITFIGSYSFCNNKLKTIDIPNSVTIIGSGAFKNNQITSLTIPNPVQNIGSNAFENNQITSLTLPNSVTIIGPDAFERNQLTSLTIPESVTSIGTGAFGYNKLTKDSVQANEKWKTETEWNRLFPSQSPIQIIEITKRKKIKLRMESLD